MAQQYATERDVAVWLGKSLVAVQKYREKATSPTPDAYVGGSPRWRLTRKADWESWFGTYAPVQAMSPAIRAKLARKLRGEYEEGASVRTLVTTYGRSYGTVHKLLGEANTRMRGRGGYNRPR